MQIDKSYFLPYNIVMRRFLVKLEFNGKHYSGWQKQSNAETVQGEVEKALSKLFGVQTTCQGCSRTDAGVSALCYYFHFDADTKLPADRVAFKLNRFLPKDIQAQESKEVPLAFDARRSVKGKTYSYTFYVSPHVRPLLSSDHVQIETSFDLEKVKREAQALVGTHDFSSFRTIGYEDNTDKKTTVRTITAIEFDEHNGELIVSITGDGFLYNMVRIVCGTLVEIGTGKLDDLNSILEAKDRSKAGKTLPPKGLKLIDVQY